MTAQTPNAEPPIVEQPPGSKPRRKRRWWVYLGAGLGVLILLAVVAVAGIVMYWHSLIRNYTAAEPQPLPAIKENDADLTAFHTRWTAFQEEVANGSSTEPFQASAAELNLLIAQNPDLKDRVRLIITNNQVFGQFSFPLDQANDRKLHGRHLNGRAQLNLAFQDGWLTVSVAELKANGKPIPRWILKKVQQQNLASYLDNNLDAIEFLHQLDAIEVEDDQIVLKPLARN